MKSHQQLAIEIEIAFVTAMAKDQLKNPEVTAVYDGLPEPILSVVMDTQTTEDKIDHIIEAVKEYYKTRTSGWSWIVGPLSKPEPTILAKHLERHDLFRAETYPGMYFNVENDLPVLPTIELDIREVDASDDLSTWIIPVREAFPPSKDKAEGFRELNARLPHGVGTNFRHYVGYVKENPVAASTLFLHGESAMIHNVATMPAFQRRQIGSAMVMRALHDAKMVGVKHCFLDASEKGKNVYSRLGFEEYAEQWLYKLSC